MVKLSPLPLMLLLLLLLLLLLPLLLPLLLMGALLRSNRDNAVLCSLRCRASASVPDDIRRQVWPDRKNAQHTTGLPLHILLRGGTVSDRGCRLLGFHSLAGHRVSSRKVKKAMWRGFSDPAPSTANYRVCLAVAGTRPISCSCGSHDAL